MMNTFKKLYKEFFGLREAKISVDSKNPAAIDAAEQMAKSNPDAELRFEEKDLVDEAQLLNKITDYNGGVEYVVRNPAKAKHVAAEIRSWAEKKGFVILKQNISASGKVGYFYFKLGQDSASESQRIQGYIAQNPEIKHFRFNVKGQKKKETRPDNPSM